MFMDEILVAASPQGFVVDLAESLGWNSSEWSMRNDTHDAGIGTYLTVYDGNKAPLSFGVVSCSDLDPLFVNGGRRADMPIPLLIMKEAGIPPPARHIVLTDGDRTVLIDTSAEEPVLIAETLDRFDAVIKPLLRRENVLNGSLRELRRKSFIMLARELRAWLVEWQRTLTAEVGLPHADVCALLDRLIILRAMMDFQTLDTISNRKLYKMQKAAVQGFLSYHRSGPVKWCRYLSILSAEYGLDILGLSESIDRLFAPGAPGPDLCRSLMQLSRTKFTLPVVLESFNYGDPTEKSLVRMTPKFNDEIEFHLSGQTPETMAEINLEANLGELGYRGVLNLFDRLLKLHDEMKEISDMRKGPENGNGNGNGNGQNHTFSDAPRFVMSHSFEVHVNSEHQRRVVTLLLHLHILHHHNRAKSPLSGFPPIAERITSTSDHPPILLNH